MNSIFNTSRLTRKVFTCMYFLFISFFAFSQLPSGFLDAKSQGGYTAPMGVIFSNNGQKMFVWEKKGTLWVSNWNGSTYVKQADVVLDMSEEVADWRDFGFQSVALDPNFDSNGLIYLFYQVDRHHLINFGTPQYNSATDEYFSASISRLSRYKVNISGAPMVADKATRKVLLGETKSTGVPLTYHSHAGGQIVFGADGTLLVTTGDNASFNGADVGNAPETYFQQAINDGIMRATENVGALRSQMINSFCGKLLRLDPNTGDGISSNPYYDAANSRSAKSRVWALGFRNPYRISFKTGTGSTSPSAANPGTILIADVQNGGWEELHVLEKGGINCGWPLFEGIKIAGGFYDASATVLNQEEAGSPTFQSLCGQATSLNVNATPSQRRFTHFAPAIEWKHTLNDTRYPDFSSGSLVVKTIGSAGALVAGTPFQGNCGTSGTYYAGTAFPSTYRNVYFFADYGANWIKAAVVGDNSSPQINEVKNFAPAGYGKGIVDIEYCPLDGSIFYVNINTGDIQKISYGSSNRPPVAAISANKTTGTSPLVVTFSSSGSSDPDGNPITYDWNFGDGTPNSTSANPSHTFTSTGTKGFTVTLTVKDNQGLSDAKSMVISVNNTAPSVKITNPTNATQYTMTGPTQYTGQSTVTDNDPTGLQYAWQVTLRHNNHEHREPIINQKNPVIQISPVGCDGDTYYYLIELKVTDNGGLTARDSVKVFPNCNSLNLSVTNLTATAQNNAVAVKWTNPNVVFDETMVVAKEGSGFLTKPIGSGYTANPNFTGSGSSFEGGKVVYKGTGLGVTVTSLTNGKKYFFRVFTRKGTTWTSGVETSATPTPTSTQQLGCLKGSYFNNKDLSGSPTIVRPESSINYDWGKNAPVSGINSDNFSVRWEGTVIPIVSGTYTFSVTVDDGVRLWVNNQLIVDKWLDTKETTTYKATINLTQGLNLPVKLEYFEKKESAVVKLFWTVPNQASKVTAFNACSINIFDPTQCYRFTARHSGKVMEIASSSTSNGAKALQNSWNSEKNQVWRIKAVDATYYRLVNGNSGKTLEVMNSSTSDGAALQQYTNGGGANQQFKFEATGSYYFIAARHSGKYLDVFGGLTANGTAIIQWPKHGDNNQQWQVSSVGCPSGTVSLLAAQIYSADGYREGRKGIITWVSNASDADYFTVEKLDKDGNFETLDIVNAKPIHDISDKNVYAYIDNQTYDGENTYRITLITDNTPPQYSNLVSLNFKAVMDFTLFPNPTSDYVDVDLMPYQDRPVVLTVIDALGREVRVTSVERAGKIHRLDLNDLTSGQYILRIHTLGKRDVTRLFNITR